MNKLDRYYKTVPPSFKPKNNKNVNALIKAWASTHEQIILDLDVTENQLFVDHAESFYLDYQASNHGTSRPKLIALADVFLRELIKKMSYSPKQIRKTIYEILDIFWGPLYSRANVTNEAAETYNLGSVLNLSGTLTFISGGAIVTGAGTFFTAEVAEGDFIKLGTDGEEAFAKVLRIIDDTTLYLASVYEGRDGTGSSNVYTPKILDLKYDSNNSSEDPISIILSPVYFSDTTTVTVAELITAINTESEEVTASEVRDIFTLEKFLNIRTNTPGSTGSIQITGGTANSILLFPVTRKTVFDLDQSTLVFEIKPNEIILKVPRLVAKLTRTLRGAFHIHDAPAGEITAVDNINKELTVNLEVEVEADELIGKYFNAGISKFLIIGNTAGDTGVILSFESGIDLTVIDITNFNSFSMGTPALTWNLNHNLGEQYVLFTIYDSVTKKKIYPNSVTALDSNNLEITFDTATQAAAFVSAETSIEVSSASTAWTINHGLNTKFLQVKIYNAADEQIYPETITAIDADNLEITFNTAQSGWIALAEDKIIVQETAEGLWEVKHNLNNQYPNVTVYNENDEVIYPNVILSQSNNTLTLDFDEDIKGLTVVGDSLSLTKFLITDPSYTNSYIFNKQQSFYITSRRTILNTKIEAGKVYPVIEVLDSSNIPNQNGYVVFGYGTSKQEGPIPYRSRPSNNTLLLDPTYNFDKDHITGEIINYLPELVAYEPRDDGSDYPVYLTGVEDALDVAEEFIRKIIAAGIILNWEVKRPKYKFNCDIEAILVTAT